MRRACVTREPGHLGAEHDVDVVVRGAKPTRDDEAVATIVARAGEHDDTAAARAREHRLRDGGRGRAGAFHQAVRGMARLERAQLVDGENRGEAGIVHGGARIGRL